MNSNIFCQIYPLFNKNLLQFISKILYSKEICCYKTYYSTGKQPALFTIMIKASLIFQSTFAVKKWIMENRSKEEVLLANGKISYLFRKFGIPGIVGLLFIGLQPIVDGLFLGNFMGAEAMAGINLFTPIYTFMSASAVVAGIGCQTIVSISLGEQKYQRANNAFRTAFIFLTIYSIAIARFPTSGPKN